MICLSIFDSSWLIFDYKGAQFSAVIVIGNKPDNQGSNLGRADCVSPRKKAFGKSFNPSDFLLGTGK